MIHVASPYVSQQTTTLNVTLVRPGGSGRGRLPGALTIDFSASLGSPAGSGQNMPGSASHAFTPVDESITFPAGQTTETVAVPINKRAPNPGLVPIVLTVTPAKGSGAASDATVYLVSGPDAIPPSIIGVHMVRKGIAVTFSKPMSPATVENVHNYTVEHTPSPDFSLADLTSVGLIQRLNKTSEPVVLRRAIYDSSANTVTLIPKVSLPASGTYQISSPASLGSKRVGPHKAQPLADLQGTALNPGGIPVAGAFSVSIRRGHPYIASAPLISVGQ
jgi:hypothetical protein